MSATGFSIDPSQSVCANCGLQAPTRDVTFHQNIGMLVTRRTAKASGNMCRRCIRAYFKSYTVTTLFLGWWGVISFVVTPFFLLNNIRYFLLSLKMPDPSPFLSDIPTGAPKPISVGAGNKKFKIIYGVIVCSVLLGLVAYNNVDFVERHAPSLNAQLHSGEITEGSDAEYAGMKIFSDLEALNADTKSDEWAGLRAEYLSRESYLIDLKDQNDRLQRAVSKERASGKQEFCEQLAIDQLLPAVNDYTTVMDRSFSVIRSAVTPTQDAVSTLKNFAAQENRAKAQISTYISEAKARGCIK